jgi:hypothetical protein
VARVQLEVTSKVRMIGFACLSVVTQIGVQDPLKLKPLPRRLSPIQLTRLPVLPTGKRPLRAFARRPHVQASVASLLSSPPISPMEQRSQPDSDASASQAVARPGITVAQVFEAVRRGEVAGWGDWGGAGGEGVGEP